MRKLIVDGYNLILCYHDKDRLVGHDLEVVRDKAIAGLRDYAMRHPSVDVTIVLDGRTDSVRRGRRMGQLRVDFRSGGPHAADRRIMSMLDETDTPQACVVVTSDRDLREYARSKHAEVVESTVYANKLGLRPQHQSQQLEEKPFAADSDWSMVARECTQIGQDTHVLYPAGAGRPVQKRQPTVKRPQTPAAPQRSTCLRVTYGTRKAVLRWSGLTSSKLALNVYDARSRQVWAQIVDGPSGTQELVGLRPGVYTVNMKGNGGEVLAGKLRIKRPAGGNA